ncbi:peroxidase [Marchantia polymorpha subsp. ruderalis]|uniref:Peroxidase n=2 Tax=Marchantia polymorpha TaxID=3197 RepID=A0A176VWW2_MARPO|nr:hypothetical protein AXG93_1420s1100 [Marchantia polymorpha subsp. ruderalis]PTQ35947.1 hypothetical protein MARPO_0067s0039 [Marchantia polymorpha]BBN18087.1 hypothetical protein Mp_7g19390 [Marchantia polymorpha subsp. ruderalis]|eukprot:PTQ35947.1 hypothetical protein MARPO_0067s0039 [Marchantia polymorpha]
MENPGRKLSTSWVLVLFLGALLTDHLATGQLSSTFYDSTCPDLLSTVKSGLDSAAASDSRLGGSLLRLHFHDCFVNGCDASVLLDDTTTFTGEKTAGPNANSLRGFNVVDDIKASVEAICPATVSCADILAILARDGTVAAGGPSWTVELGRRDGLTASKSAAESDIPNPTTDVLALTSSFSNVGLDQTDLAALSGAHTFGKAQCGAFVGRLYDYQGTGSPDPSIDPDFLATLQAACPDGGDATVLNNLDQGTPTTFDNSYYNNLLTGKGLLNSDQVLETTAGTTQDLVTSFGSDQSAFFSQFATSMIKMGGISVLTGSSGEIRTNCRAVNS